MYMPINGHEVQWAWCLYMKLMETNLYLNIVYYEQEWISGEPGECVNTGAFNSH